MLHSGNQHIWPPKTRLTFSLPHDKLYETMRGRRFDLAAQLDQWTGGRKFCTARLAVAVEAKEWTVWNEESLGWIEQHVVLDLWEDSYRARLERRTDVGAGGLRCSEPFQWRLRIVNVMA